MAVDGLRARVRVVIDASGRSQSAFAEAIGLDSEKLSRSLAGTRCFTPLELALIAEEGGTSTDWLLGWIGERRMNADAVMARQIESAGNVVSGLGRHDLANHLWALAHELREDAVPYA